MFKNEIDNKQAFDKYINKIVKWILIYLQVHIIFSNYEYSKFNFITLSEFGIKSN